MSYPTSNNDASNNRDESNISEPSFPLHRHEVSKNRRKERRGSPNSLIERDWQISKRNVAKDNRNTKHKAKSRNLHKLDPRSNSLHRNHLQPSNRNIAKQRASSHVAHSQEDRVLEAIVAKQILVQQKNANVGRVPGNDKPDREKTTRTFHFGCRSRWRAEIFETRRLELRLGTLAHGSGSQI